MNKLLLFILLFSFQVVHAQVISINPNSGDYGQTLNTTITLASGVINMGSPPMQNGDIYLKHGSYTIHADNFQISPGPFHDDTVNATFTIPPVIPPGLYDVHVITYINNPWPSTNDNILANGFLIHPSASLISGNVYLDMNQNGIRDTNEIGLSNIHLTIAPGNYTLMTDSSGNYTFYCDTNIYTVTLATPLGYTPTTPAVISNISTPPNSTGNDFGLYFPIPNPVAQEFWLYTHPMRCMYYGFSGWNIRNELPITETGSITVIHSPNLTFSSSSLPPNSTSGDTLTWNYTLSPNQHIYCGVTYTNPPAGDTIWYTVIDSVFYNNVFQGIYMDSFQFIVSCSVDPNDKHCSPEGEGPMHLTLKDSELTYLINFQNTGTDTAFNVVVLDTLDSNLDFASLQILSSSDPVDVTLQQNGALRFTFDNIMLPDSNVDEPGSHGYVTYRIKPLQNLPDSTIIENTAYIYFDFNSPVVTNTAFNNYVSQIQVSVKNIQTEQLNLLYPNPVTQTSCLYIPTGTYHLNIYDVSGRELVSCDVSGKYMINKSEFVEGVYFYRVTNSNTSMSGKFIVVK